MDRPDCELPADVVAAIHAGRKIDAIKQLRAEHDIGLKEAREIVDAYIEGYPGLERTRGPKTETGLGCLVLVGVVMAVLYFLYAICPDTRHSLGFLFPEAVSKILLRKNRYAANSSFASKLEKLRTHSTNKQVTMGGRHVQQPYPCNFLQLASLTLHGSAGQQGSPGGWQIDRGDLARTIHLP